MEDFSFVSDINEKLRECGVWAFSFKGNKRVIVHHDGETMSVRSTRTRANSRIDMLTDMLLDETPDIDSDFKDFLVVHPTEVFLVKERNGVYVSVYLRNKTPNSLVSAQASYLTRVIPAARQRPYLPVLRWRVGGLFILQKNDFQLCWFTALPIV